MVTNEPRRIECGAPDYDIEFSSSYEGKERAKKHFDVLKASLEQKYGECNVIQTPDRIILEGTDGVTSVCLTRYESSTLNGENRFFCSLVYIDDVLYNTFAAQNTPDL